MGWKVPSCLHEDSDLRVVTAMDEAAKRVRPVEGLCYVAAMRNAAAFCIVAGLALLKQKAIAAGDTGGPRWWTNCGAAPHGGRQIILKDCILKQVCYDPHQNERPDLEVCGRP
jgi:hypothetical protein